MHKETNASQSFHIFFNDRAPDVRWLYNLVKILDRSHQLASGSFSPSPFLTNLLLPFVKFVLL